MIGQPAIVTGGIADRAGPLEKNPVMSYTNGAMYISYTANDRLRKKGHQHWMLAPFLNSYAGGSAADGSNSGANEVSNVLEDPRISGIVWTVNWKQIETAFNVYDMTAILRILRRCAYLKKKCIIRGFDKTYSGAFLNTPGVAPTTINVPTYLTLDPGTYGTGVTGDPTFRGGLYLVYQSGVAVGWGAFLENDNTRARWKAMVAYIAAQLALPQNALAASAFAGWAGPDESTRSAYDGSGLPAGMTAATIAAANRDIYLNDFTCFGNALLCWPHINYIDNLDTRLASNAFAQGEQAWVASQGMNNAVTDVYVLPTSGKADIQPVYQTTPRTDLAKTGTNPATGGQGAATSITIDALSSLGAYNAGTAAAITLANGIQANCMGADLTVWNPLTATAGGNADARWWPAMQDAIDKINAAGYRS